MLTRINETTVKVSTPRPAMEREVTIEDVKAEITSLEAALTEANALLQEMIDLGVKTEAAVQAETLQVNE